MNNNELLLMIESLPVDIKIQLIDRLLRSLNPIEKEVDQLWANEAENRVEEIKTGKVQLIDGDEVLKEARERLPK